MAYIELNEEERAAFFMQYFNDSDADEEFEGFDEFDIAENIEIVIVVISSTGPRWSVRLVANSVVRVNYCQKFVYF
jgi:hypothetical protein